MRVTPIAGVLSTLVCRFDAAKTRHGPAPALVRQRLTFTSRKLQIAFIPPADLPSGRTESAACPDA